MQKCWTYQKGDDDGPFLQLSRINLEKYSKNQNQAKILFEHILIVTGDYRAALTLAEYCDKENEEDGYWKVRGFFLRKKGLF